LYRSLSEIRQDHSAQSKLYLQRIEVILKDQAAHLWREKATRLADFEWRYLKVPQQEFENLHPESFGDLCIAFAH